MADVRPTTITTSDRCPACGIDDIAPQDGAPAESVHICRCLACSFVFYRYRRVADDTWRRRPRSISGGAPAQPTWRRMRRRPGDFVDELVTFGADVLRSARATRERSRAIRTSRWARPALPTPRD
jgi:hypothetical protein